MDNIVPKLHLVSNGDKKTLIGHTEPRIHTPYVGGQSKVQEVIDLADLLGMPLMPWQVVVLTDWLAIDDEGHWIKKTCGLLVARQNGKTHLARMRIIAGLHLWGEKILALSSDRGLALENFLEIAAIIDDNDFLREALRGKPRLSNGSEIIRFKNGASFTIAAATRGASRGRWGIDLLYVDELREIKPEAWTAARPVTRAKPHAQTITTSNAGDAFSMVLNNLRNNALSYPPQSLGWYEYSAEAHCKIGDRKAWQAANPALGYTITEETLEESVATDSLEAVRTEMLCQWVDSLASPWPEGVIEATSNSDLAIESGGNIIYSVDVSPSRRTGSLQAGKVMPDGKIGVAVLQIWTSDVAVDDLKIAADISDWTKKLKPTKILYDKYATASIISRLERSGHKCEDISGQLFYQACGELLDALVANRIVHSGQPDLVQQFNNCAAKVSDAGWRIIRRKSAGDVTIPIGVAMLAHELIKPVQIARVIS
jgi:phage terminase large subunit-like protein